MSLTWAGFTLHLWWPQLILQYPGRQGWPLDWLWDLVIAAVVQQWVGLFCEPAEGPGCGCCAVLVSGVGSKPSFEACQFSSVHFSSFQSLSPVRLFVTLWTAACQAFLSITNSQSLLKLMSIESVMPSSHLILCYPLLLPPSIFPSIRVFSNESVLHIKWPKYWSFSFSISPSYEYSGLISFRME